MAIMNTGIIIVTISMTKDGDVDIEQCKQSYPGLIII